MKEIILKLIDKGLIEGITGLIGVFLGWFLSWLSQKGKLHIFVKNGINAKFTSEADIPSFSKNEAKCFSYNISLDIYNASNNTKILRDIRVLFYNGKKVIKNDIPKDCIPNDPVNITAKSVLNLRLHNYFWNEEMGFIWDVTSIKLEYKNSKNVKETKTLEKISYNNYDFEQGAEQWIN